MITLNISIIAIEQNVDVITKTFIERGHEVQVFSDKVDFISCFDSDFLVVCSEADLKTTSSFFISNRIPILIERRLCGGKKVLCVGNASNLLFAAPVNNDDLDGEISFIEQWNACSSNVKYSGEILVTEIEEKHSFLDINEIVQCKNQFLVFEHPALGLDCKYTQPPNVAWGKLSSPQNISEDFQIDNWAEKQIVLSVQNGALSALMFTPNSKVIEDIISLFESK